MKTEDIPLKVLVCDPDPSSAELLRSAIAQRNGVAGTVVAAKIADAQATLRAGDINTIFIDIIGLGISAGADFVFSVRSAASLGWTERHLVADLIHSWRSGGVLLGMAHNLSCRCMYSRLCGWGPVIDQHRREPSL